MNKLINDAFMRLTRRAEAADPSKLVQTFVDAEPLLTLLFTTDHQILYGRRGTGKTHALLYLFETEKQKGNIPIYVDVRKIGSTGGLYSDPKTPLAERATRLLLDALGAVHDGVLQFAIDNSESTDLAAMTPLLDNLAAAITEVVVVGEEEREELAADRMEDTDLSSFGAAAGTDMMGVALQGSESKTSEARHEQRIKRTGTLRHRLHFGRLGKAFEAILDSLSPRRIWVLIDEWSIIPLDLQPYLADIIKRAIMPCKGVSVKIGAIEQRSQFQHAIERGDYVGFELGADITADLNLDDFMVFENDASRAIAFFQELLFKHFRTVDGVDLSEAPKTAAELAQGGFTQRNALEEFVRAAEGVPRDAINVISLAAQKALGNPISVPHVRAAARAWYQRDKETAVSTNIRASSLLHWIIDEVIAHRRARAFLLRTDVRHDLIDVLFDARVLHLLKKNVSAHDQPGVRYSAYKFDYGCYVDLLATTKAPLGLLPSDDEGAFVEVPPDDYRAIRRAILEMSEFEARSPVRDLQGRTDPSGSALPSSEPI